MSPVVNRVMEFGVRVHLDLAGCDCAGRDLEPETAARVVQALLQTKEIVEIHITRERLEVVVFVPEKTEPMALRNLRERFALVAYNAKKLPAELPAVVGPAVPKDAP